MDFQDHAYTTNQDNPAEFTYKMGAKQVEEFVKLRVSNNYLFSGKKHTSMLAWRAILKHMGLQHKLTHTQAKKKWENMRKRHKQLKYPPAGVTVFPELWPYFTLMEDALQGRLEGSAPILKASGADKDSGDFLPTCKTKKNKVCMDAASSTASIAGGPEIEVSLNGDEDGEQGCTDIDRIMLEVDNERNVMDNERQAMVKEKQLMDRERQVLQRERAVLDREVAALDRERASLERERAMMEREKVMMEREKSMVEKDKDSVCRARQALEREKATLERLYGSKERTEELTEDTDIIDGRKERFLHLFEKLIENL